MRNKFLYIVLIVFILLGCSKDKKSQSGQSSDSIPIYLSIVENKSTTLTQKRKVNRKAFRYFLENPSVLEDREGLNKIALNFSALGEKESFKYASLELAKISEKIKDTLYLVKGYKNLGEYYIDGGQNDSSYYYFLKAEKLAVIIRDSVALGEIHLDKAFIQLYESDFNGSEISAFKSLAYLSKSSKKIKIYEAYNLIGINSNELKNYDKAIEYHNKALKYLSSIDDKKKSFLMASSLNNLGYVYQTTGNHKLAIDNFTKALNIKSLNKEYPGIYAMLIDNIAYSQFRLKDYSNLPSLFFKSLKIRDSLKNDYSGIILNKLHLSEFFLVKGDSLQSKKFALQALRDSRKTRVSSDIMLSLQQLTLLDHENAVSYSREYIKISDSLKQAERQAKDKFARLAFETDEILMEKDKLAEQNRSLLYFFVGTLLVGLLLFIIRAQRAKNRELLLMQEQQKTNEEIYNLIISQQANIEESRVKEKKRIAQELHDGVLGRLFGARLNLDSLNRFTDEESIDNRFNYLAELKNIEQDIREISHDLNREKYVLINNFVAIVNNLLEEQQNSYKANVISNIDPEIKWEKLSNTIKINLYRIIQESLQNINKYANARRIEVEIVKDEVSIRLKIVDDGKGFETATKKKGIGLQNMYARAKECNGTFEIISNRGEGTIINISLPIKEQETIATL